ncbi:hypothetical protein BpHYR1_046672 [Brachionus plicatilis]|uniref:Uncharacterized protein n=1 Tax=Brachionus plicatilis TaxID=10195 RepID=A0A3M7RVR2_BRAPC|nr:hypothetical protein BpHYR1_046672 [Brachionus plicatilis]
MPIFSNFIFKRILIDVSNLISSGHNVFLANRKPNLDDCLQSSDFIKPLELKLGTINESFLKDLIQSLSRHPENRQ